MAGGSQQNHGLELERARSVQLSMLPEVPRIESIEIAASYRACDMLGGDFYDFILIDNWRLGVVIADVSGHGTAAALLMAAAKKVLQLCGRGTISPRQTLLEVNDSIRADIPNGMFLSVLYGVIDIRSQKLCFASCGHNPPVIRRGDRLNFSWNHDNAPVLGIMPSSQLDKYLREEFVQLQADDLLLFYTDGLTEAFNNDKAMYGEERLISRVRSTPAGDAQSLVDAIRADVDSFRENATLSDDETLLVIRIGQLNQQVEPLVAGGASSTSSLPTFRSPMIGRDTVTGDVVSKLIAKAHPVLTLVGTAGAGKSRIAIAATDSAQEAFPGGIHYVDLQKAASIGDVCRQVATALRLGDDETHLGLRISMALHSPGGPTLLVLDNCERARDAVRRCIEEWQSRAESLSVLTTSRVPLDVKGEQPIQIPPLAAPRPGRDVLKTPADAERFDSVRLFLQRAREADRDFRYNDQNYQDVARICARLDGLPQAIELAAGRAAVLSPRQILERLDQRFELLQGGEHSERTTLQGTLAMSWDLLPAHEQQALMLLAQFPDGFQLDVAGPVLGLAPGHAPEDLVNSLLKQSLLHADVLDDLGGERRFTMYESIRAFGLEKLRASPLAGKAREAFENAVLKYALHWWKLDRDQGSSQGRRRVQHEVEAMLEVVAGTSSPESRAWCTVMVAPILYNKGDQERAMGLLRGAQAGLLPGSDEYVWINVTDAMLRVNEAPEHAAEVLKNVHGEPDVCFTALLTRAIALQALGRANEAIETLRDAGRLEGLTPIREARLKDRLGVIYGSIGRPKDAKRLYESALQQARDHDDAMLVARIIFNLGWVNMRGEHSAQAVTQLQEALQIAQREDDRGFESSALGGLALALHLAGQRQEAEACMLRGIRLSRELGRTFTEVAQLNTLTRIYHEQGRDEEALQVATKARKLAFEIGSRKSEALAEGNIAALSMVLGKDVQGAEAAWRRSYKILLDLGEMRSALASLSNLGVMLGERWKAKGNERELHAAVETLNEATTKRRELGYDPLVDAELLLAELLVETGKRREARELLEKTLQTARGRGDDIAKKTVVDGERLLAELETETLIARGKLSPRIRAPEPVAKPRSVVSASGRAPSGRNPGKRPRMGNRPRSSNVLPTVQAPPKAGSSSKLPTIQAPPQKTGSSGPMPRVQAPPQKRDSTPSLPRAQQPKKKSTSSNLPPLKSKRPKGQPGAAPRRRPRGYT
ncbi:MAG: SpoIIE family protein phosphatase [Planctomycetes bacterium]|nr:SpoIIE family protein phosphatase [Planctomycetota bacterium]